MSSHSLSVKEIEKTIKNLDFAKQKQLIKDLPKLIKLSPLDPDFLKLAESSFSFWDNHEDAIYDKL